MISAKYSRMALLMLLLSLPVAVGCGKKGPPLPPVEEKSVTGEAPAAPAGQPAEPAPAATPY